MRRKVSTTLVLLIAICGAAYGQTADDVARRAIDVLAGPAWEKARYFAFTFNVERDGKIAASYPQRWDRFTGDYRVSGKNREGQDILVIMNVNAKTGKAWRNGEEVADPAELLTFGYRRFINDTFWLLMGFKSFDPGVNREFAGEKTNCAGETLQGVRFSFEKVGLTPGDVYWMWINRDTGLVEEWDMRLQGSKPEDEAGAVLFRDYRRFGGLLISTKREIKGRGQFIRLDDITVAETVTDGAFTK
jgi:hypothetical protein